MTYSVVIPAHNAASTLAETLHSVLAQTVPADEIIVVDDGSTDDTRAVALQEGGPIRVLGGAHQGPGGATTAGLSAVRCEIVATLDSDDLWLPHKMEMQLACLSKDPGLNGVFSHWRTFKGSPEASAADTVSPGWARTTMAIRAADARRVGPVIDPHGYRGEMIDWIARAREAGLRFEMLSDVLALRRIRSESLSYGRNPTLDRGYVEVAWRALKRRHE